MSITSFALTVHVHASVFVGVAPSVSEILFHIVCLPLKNSQISLSEHELYSPWSSKNLIEWNRLKKFMQVGIDV